MKTNALVSLPLAILLSYCAGGFAMESADPPLGKIMIDQLEVRQADEHHPVIVEAEGWLGRDLDKFWIKAEMEHRAGAVTDGEVQLLYSKAVSPFWDLQMGFRQDIRPQPEQSWAAIGFKGLAPGFIDTDMALFFGEGGQTELRLEAEYELMISQKLVLTPELEVRAFGKTLESQQQGSGLAKASAGLRLAYEIRREFAPYIGVTRAWSFGATADLEPGENSRSVRWVLGIRAWF